MSENNPSPTITFRVNLETVGGQNASSPNRTTLSGNETVTEAASIRNTRTVYIPTLLGTNIEGIGPSGYLHHGDTFTAYGMKAVYLKKTYVKGNVDDILQIVE